VTESRLDAVNFFGRGKHTHVECLLLGISIHGHAGRHLPRIHGFRLTMVIVGETNGGRPVDSTRFEFA